MITQRPSTRAVPFRKRVHTLRGVQVHRGYRGLVQFPGQREPEYCGHFHQKSKSARECAERYARMHWDAKLGSRI